MEADDAKLTRRERALRYALIFMALVFAGFIVAYLLDGAIFDIDDYKTKVTRSSRSSPMQSPRTACSSPSP